MSAGRAAAAALAGTTLLGASLLTGPLASAAVGQKCAAPTKAVVRTVPWAQQAMAPQRAWMLTRGGGVTVAVVDTGVSAAAPALAGLVLPGRDVSTNGPANTDCRGHGTFVAGLLAARPTAAGSGLAGIAPDVRILPIRVADSEDQVDPGKLATGIRDAADGGARVIAVALSTGTAPPALRAAVAHAVARDVVVVASTDRTGLDSTSGGAVYPADLPGVLSVASMQSDGRPTALSGSGGTPSLAAPGAGLLSVAPQGDGNVTASGAGVAVAFVAGAAALVRDYRPGLRAEQVRHRLEATADHPTGQLPDPGVGYGTVDPVAAVTTALPEETGETAAKPESRPVHLVLPPRPDRSAEQLAFAASAAVTGCALLGGLLVATVRRGRRRGWRAGAADDT